MIKFGVSMSTYEPKMGPITFAKGRVQEKLEQINKIGYTGIDLFAHKMSNKELTVFKNSIDALKLEVSLFIPFYLTEQGINLSHPDKNVRKANVKAMINEMDVAKFLGAVNMPIGYQRGRILSSDSFDNYEKNLAESLAELGEAGIKKGIVFCFEPINFNEMNTFFSSIETLDYLKKFKLDNIMLLLDSHHIEYENRSQADAINYCKGRIGHYHVSDTMRLPVGQGRIDYDEVLSSLIQVGYSGYVSMESVGKPDSYTAALFAYKHLSALLRKKFG